MVGTIDIVTTHCGEPPHRVAWMEKVLTDHIRTSIFIYECYTPSLLPPQLAAHPRVTLRDKRGVLRPTTQYYSFFDHIVQSYDSLVEYTLFVHLHDTSYHRLTSMRTIMRQCYELTSKRARPVGYVNVGDAVVSTWTGCAQLQAAVTDPVRRAALAGCSEPDGVGPCPSMLQRVLKTRRALEVAVGGHVALGPRLAGPLVDINGAEALVHRCRLRARPPRAWARLRDMSRSGAHHALLDYAIEGR